MEAEAGDELGLELPPPTVVGHTCRSIRSSWLPL